MLAPTFHSAGRSATGPSIVALVTVLAVATTAVIAARALPQSPIVAPAPAAVVEALAALPSVPVAGLVHPALEEFAAGGVDGGATGVRVDEAGHFAVRADVLSALHTTVLLDLGDVALPIDLRGARIYGLHRGAPDLASLEGARVLVRGVCPGGATPRGARCLSDTVVITFGHSGRSIEPITIDARVHGT